MPWAAANEARRLIALPYIRALFRLHGISWGTGWRIFGMPIIQRYRGSTIQFGSGLSMRSWTSTNPLTPYHPVVIATRSPHAVIRVGDDCGFSGAIVVAATSVEIGNRVVVGANTIITDTDFHPLDPEDRRRDFNAGSTRPIVIEDDVFIGMNSIILKGVRLGRGCVVGAASVVARDVPPGAIAAGNPARIVRDGPAHLE